MTHYTFHYACGGSDTHKITCGRLSQAFADRLRELFPPAYRLAPRSQDYSEESSEGDELPARPPPGGGAAPRDGPSGEAGDPAERLADPALWASAAELQWALAADQVIREVDLARTVARLRADGELGAVRRSCLSLAEALVAVHPALRDEPLSTRLQLVALGADMALAAAGEPGLLQYVKNELQRVDLAGALGAP